jgi:GT2 family glycosyltransferase
VLDLSIIIVNWHSVEYLRKCLASIYENTTDVTFEVVVVDNASQDGCSEMLAREFHLVRFIQSLQNLGFSGGNNLGFRYSSGRNILCLNPDTEVVGPALTRMIQFLDTHADAGIVGAKLLASDGSIDTSCIRRFPTVLNQAVDADYLRGCLPAWRFWGFHPLVEKSEGATSVEVVSGACLMIRRSVFEHVGLFDECYFMYAEDDDLCFKVSKVGWRNYYLGNAVVVHHGSKSARGASRDNFSAVMMRESLELFFAKHRGRIYARMYRLIMACVASGRILLLVATILLTLGSYRRETLRGSLRKWVRVCRWSLGLEKWVERVSSQRSPCHDPVTFVE